MSTTAAARKQARTTPLAGMLDQVARRVLLYVLRNVTGGEIEICDSGERVRLGREGELRAAVIVNDARFFRAAVIGGSLAVADSFLRGDWDCDQLTSFFRVFIRDRESANRLDRGLARLMVLPQRLLHWRRANTRRGSRRNISAHLRPGQ